MGLTPSQVEQYHEQGYLKLENVLDPETDLDPVIRAYEGVVDERARKLYAAGKISSLYEGEDFGHRLAKIAAEAPEAAQDLDIYKVRHPDMFAFLCNPKIHDLIESLVGTGHPVPSLSAPARHGPYVTGQYHEGHALASGRERAVAGSGRSSDRDHVDTATRRGDRRGVPGGHAWQP